MLWNETFWGLSKHCALKLDFGTYFILSMMYLSGISPSWPRTEPFHQSLETCLKSTMVSPLWKLTSRVERALKSYNAWATSVSGSANKKTFLYVDEFFRFNIFFANFLVKSKLFRTAVFSRILGINSYCQKDQDWNLAGHLLCHYLP